MITAAISSSYLNHTLNITCIHNFTLHISEIVSINSSQLNIIVNMICLAIMSQ